MKKEIDNIRKERKIAGRMKEMRKNRCAKTKRKIQ